MKGMRTFVCVNAGILGIQVKLERDISSVVLTLNKNKVREYPVDECHGGSKPRCMLAHALHVPITKMNEFKMMPRVAD